MRRWSGTLNLDSPQVRGGVTLVREVVERDSVNRDSPRQSGVGGTLQCEEVERDTESGLSTKSRCWGFPL